MRRTEATTVAPSFRKRSRKVETCARAAKSGMVSGLFDEGDLPELPEKWVWTTVGALAAPEKNSITDGPFGSNLKTEHYTTIGPRVIRLQNIGDYRFVDVEAHISNQHFDTLTKHQIRAGDVAIACLGEAKVNSKRGSIEIDAEFGGLQRPTSFGNEYLTYILWAISPEGRAVNLGEV